ncbi:hypothetical protein [Parendozoicomonas haliclonae]|uniref:Uncharacterized protein n=1 Tax=Parendozoicomonas haliclonae TaxID=1960125 RepID=A0A1X7ARE0_9GAMM|nr:hypothetical protein [Parendozoicomonas haliclonae]SMA50650.1 hypothetical protein EHSB41UT_04467 [Parendozoicomonas haliclonae]
MPKITIVPDDSDLKPLEVRTKWQTIGDANATLISKRRMAEEFGKPAPVGELKENPVPWVKSGNLYLSLFETGDNSWKPIIINLANTQNRKLFTVLTGRHGSNMHFTKPDGQFTQVKDISHLRQDLQKKSQVMEQVPSDVDIMILDVTDPDFNSERRLRSCIRQHIQSGRTVILAWCFSIYAMKGVPENSTMDVINKKYPGLIDQPVRKIMRDDWSPV